MVHVVTHAWKDHHSERGRQKQALLSWALNVKRNTVPVQIQSLGKSFKDLAGSSGRGRQTGRAPGRVGRAPFRRPESPAVTRRECLAEEGAKQAARLGALDARHFGGADLQRGAQRAQEALVRLRLLEVLDRDVFDVL